VLKIKSKRFKTDNEIVLNNKYIDDVIIFDLECSSLNTDDAKMTWFGCYSYKHGKYFMLQHTERDAIQKLIDDHKVLVGFNSIFFDSPILTNETNQYDLSYKIQLDCLKVLYHPQFRKPVRENIIKVNGKTIAELLPNRKLKTIAEVLGFPITKGDIDYKIFQKDSWTEQEQREIIKYLYADVDITRRLFEFYLETFEPFREYVGENDQRNFNYVRSSMGAYVYAAVCHNVGLEPVYAEDDEVEPRPKNDGGFVQMPVTDYAEGNIVLGDFSSIYPNIMFMCNIFSEDDNGWSGDGFYDEVVGSYNTSKLGKIEEFVKQIYLKRKAFKKIGDPRELPLKIMINTIYGLCGSPRFLQLFKTNRSGDVTAVGRKMIKYVRDRFNADGYRTLYGDTDSCFIQLPDDKTIDDYKQLAEDVMTEIFAHVPFPSADTFTFEVDGIFKKIWLFKKKHYIGITDDNKLVVKGLKVKKNDCSELGKKIFSNLKPLMLERGNIKFDREYITQLVDCEMRNDLKIIARMYSVKPLDCYNSESSIQAQISKQYGDGEHYLIPNRKYGKVGKCKKYIRIDDPDVDLLTVDDIYFDSLWNELSPFIKKED